MVKSAPASPFVVPQTKLLLQLQIVAFDDPTMLRPRNQLFQRNARFKRGEPVLGGLGIALRPFDEEPFFRMGLGSPGISMCRPDPNRSKSGAEPFPTAFAPGHVVPRFRGETDCQLLRCFRDTG